jgi:hypothetical protein
VFLAATPAVANDAGKVEVVDQRGHALGDGGSTTPFELRLPVGAACPGDSEHDQYRIMGFMVPADVDPAKVRYQLGPVGERSYSLYQVDSTQFSNALTERADRSGGEGAILDLPTFSFGVFNDVDRIEPGRYRMGIACAHLFETKRYWSTEIVLASDLKDRPAGIHWNLPNCQPAGDDNGALAGVIVAVALAAAAGFVALAARKRGRRRPAKGRR